MADVITPTFSFTLPEIGGSDNTWGDKLNANTTLLDTLLKRLVPVGAIVMWGGAVAAIPDGWQLCDGTKGSPDLRDKFIVGAGTTYDIAAKGGAATVTLTAAQTPAHTHTVTGNTGGQSASHSHSGWTDSQGVHTHQLVFAASSADDGPTSAGGTRTDGGGQPTLMNGNHYATAAGAHSHNVGTHAASNDHHHGFSGTTSSVGGGAAHENLPPYFALAYIQKT